MDDIRGYLVPRGQSQMFHNWEYYTPKAIQAAIQEKIAQGEHEQAEYIKKYYIKPAGTPDKGVSEQTSRGFRGVVERYL